MAEEEPRADIAELEERFPEAVEPLGGGVLQVETAHLLEVAKYMREDPDLAFDYLSSITGVDRIGEGRFEVVYHLYSMRREAGPLVLKVFVPREEPVVPSLAAIWSGANVQEREVYDLMGIRFSGHPNLKRILLWEGYDKHPLRKDFQED